MTRRALPEALTPTARTLRTARPRATLNTGRRDWYRLTNLADGGVDLFIYDEIGFFGITASALVDQLRDLETDHITLRLNSPGGEIFDGIAIYNALRSHQAKVTVQVDSIAASIASVIAMAGDEVVMGPFSQMMIHDGLGMVMGNAADMREMADLLDRQSDNIAAIYQARAGGQARSWRAKMRAETWYSAQEAVAAGLADKVASPSKPGKKSGKDDEGKPPAKEDPDKDAPAGPPDEDEDKPFPPEDRWDLTVFRYAGRAASPGPYAALIPDAAAGPHDPAPEGDGGEGAAPPLPSPPHNHTDWAAMTARLTTTSTDDFARLREGLLS